MEVKEDDYLAHYGILRKSGRYPWGSGANPNQRSRSFLDVVKDHKKNDGMSDTDIAKAYGMTRNQLSTTRTIAVNQLRQDKIRQVERMAAKGMSDSAIGRQMGIAESSVRSLRAPGVKEKTEVLSNTAAMLKRQVEEKGAIDIGAQVERALPIGEDQATLTGISREKMNSAVDIMREQGYEVHYVPVLQQTTGNFTTRKVLARPDVKYGDLRADPSKIKLINEHTDDGGRNFDAPGPPKSMSSKRIQVAYKEDGGHMKDGLIEIRPGAKDLDMGKSNYAQVRIAVDGSHYLKGMAVYNKDLPAGVDVRFNTNKSKKDAPTKHDAMKPMEKGPDGKPDLAHPFSADIKRGGQRGHLNIVNEKGDWDKQAKVLASQMLAKQHPDLAKTQLALTFDRRRKELDSILKLTNPAVRKTLLRSFSDETDSAASHLKAAGMHRQATKVLIPIHNIKPNEVYAPSLRDGEMVALVRFPHGGTFEIPNVRVNNKSPEARKILGGMADDAIGIHHSVAERLSGADFDGDTVLAIPNNRGEITHSPALRGLKDFDPREQYRPYDGMKTIDGGVYNAKTREVEFPKGKPKRGSMQQEMGYISNLITDMTIHGATNEEKAKAVRHSMVIIDAEKHHLDYQASKRDNNIKSLYLKYQGKSGGGASTLLSLAGGGERVPHREPRKAKDGGPIDKATGKKMYVYTGKTYEKNGKTHIVRMPEQRRLSVTDDAHQLSSHTEIENIYADHSNRLKAMGNEARKHMVNTKGQAKSTSAAKAYAPQVQSLEKKLDIAHKNAPRERQAQSIANSVVKQKKQARPDMDKDDERTERRKALDEARIRTGAHKDRITPTQEEWAAIQAGAISNHKLEQILRNSNLDEVRKLATPKEHKAMTSAKIASAKALFAQGYTQAEVADHLGVALSTLKLSLAE